jgi:hypothetical protein
MFLSRQHHQSLVALLCMLLLQRATSTAAYDASADKGIHNYAHIAASDKQAEGVSLCVFIITVIITVRRMRVDHPYVPTIIRGRRL